MSLVPLAGLFPLLFPPLLLPHSTKHRSPSRHPRTTWCWCGSLFLSLLRALSLVLSVCDDPLAPLHGRGHAQPYGVNFIPSVCAYAICITDRQSWNGKHNLPMCDVCCLADWQLRYHFPLVFIFFNRRLRDGQVLLNCGVFTEGTDIPRIDCVILARWGAAWLCGCAGAIAGARWRCCRGGVGRDGRCRCLVFFSVLFSAFTP